MSDATATRRHHPFSPSSLPMRQSCAKFTQRAGPVNEMAVVGTMQHDMAESQIDDPRLPDYRAHAVAECIRYCEDRASHYPGGIILKEEYLPIDDELMAEYYVEEFTITDPETGQQSPGYRQAIYWHRGTTGGYLDYAVVRAGVMSKDCTKAEIIDFKFGNNAVEESQNNLQGIAYALGVLKKFPRLEEITVHFIMPHLDYVTVHTFTRADFPGMMLNVIAVVRRAEEARKNPDDFSMATPNTSACLFCGLAGRCPKLAEIAIKLGRKYKPLEIPENVTPSLISDPAQASMGIRLAAVMAAWSDSYKRQATATTIDNLKFLPEDYILVTNQKRILKNARALGELAKERLKTLVPADKYEEACKSVDACYDVSFGPLEKILQTFAPRGQKEKTLEAFDAEAQAKGIVELGAPYAFLRQSRKQEAGQKMTDKK